jgi:prevent-host-death family protein
MKTVSSAEARENIERVLDSAQKERVVVTRAGKPCAVILGVEGYDREDLQLAASAGFWRMIESRRKGKEIPLSELKTRLGLKKRSPRGGGRRTVAGRRK